jgi:hypothetical protein
MDGDTTEGERLKQEGLGDSGHLANFLPWGQRVSRNLVDQLGKSGEVSEDGSGLEGRRQE